MSRTLSATISGAITQSATRPVYLIEMAFATTSRAATWDSAISWNGLAWAASGIEVEDISRTAARLTFPTGTSDPWLALVLNDGVRGRSIKIYEHHYNAAASPQSDATQVFEGIMDVATIDQRLAVSCIESSQVKSFPAYSVSEETFTYLLNAGDTINWANKVVTVE